VVTGLLDLPGGLQLGGEKRVVTIMMTDLRGFSALADGLDPQDVVSLLNGYLEVMTGIIMKWGGTIDEFIGDAIIVLFGATGHSPQRYPEDPGWGGPRRARFRSCRLQEILAAAVQAAYARNRRGPEGEHP
jgi:class 3 adenylate cyclase